MSTTPVRSRAPWFAPTLRHYRGSWLLRDVLAGLAAGAVVIPQAMAYASIAELPAEIGLYTCIVPMLVYAMLGGSHAMSVSTTSTLATLTATTLVTAGVALGSDDALRDLSCLTLLVGVMLVVSRLLKLGSLVEYISESTLTGVKIGVGATVAVGQLPKLLGVDSNFTGHGFFRALAATVEAIPQTNVPTLILSIVSIGLLVLLRRFLPRVPGQLIVVVGSILLISSGALGADNGGIALIEPIPTGLTAPAVPSFEHLQGMVGGAFAITIMAFLESAAVARSIRQAGEERIDSNRELLATGAVNTVGAFLNGMPAAGGFSQSAVNQGAGARTQLAGITTAILAIFTALFLGPVLSNLPEAILAAMVMVAVVPLLDPRPLIRLARIYRADFWVATITAALGLTTGLLAAVAVGVMLTLILVLRELSKARVTVVSSTPQRIVIRIESALYTANVVQAFQIVEEEVDKAGRPPQLVLDCSAVRILSVTVLDAFRDLERELHSGGTAIIVAGLPPGALETARKTTWYRNLEAEGRTAPTI